MRVRYLRTYIGRLLLKTVRSRQPHAVLCSLSLHHWLVRGVARAPMPAGMLPATSVQIDHCQCNLRQCIWVDTALLIQEKLLMEYSIIIQQSFTTCSTENKFESVA